MSICSKIDQPSFPSLPRSLGQKLFNSDNSLFHSSTSSGARRDRLVVRTLHCVRSNPGSNPGSGIYYYHLNHFLTLFFFNHRICLFFSLLYNATEQQYQTSKNTMQINFQQRDILFPLHPEK